MGKAKDKFWETFKKADIYGEQVGVNYRGEGTFSTNWGAMVSLLTIIVVFAYLGI